MKRWLTIWTGLLLLTLANFGTGCAPMPYQEPCCYQTDVIIVYEPVPYPHPGPDYNPPPTPPRHKPLTQANNSGNPRTKQPRRDGSDDQVNPPRTRRADQNRTPKSGQQPHSRPGNKRK